MQLRWMPVTCLSVALVAACGGDGGKDSDGTGGQATGGQPATGGTAPDGGGTGGQPTGGVVADAGTGGVVSPDASLPAGNFPRSGLWFVTVNVTEFSNYQLPLQLEIEGDEAGHSLRSVALRAVNIDHSAVSDVLVTLNDVPVDENGHFEFGFENAVLPAAYTITNSDLTVTIQFKGDATGNDFFCGSVTGAVVTLDKELVASTFAGVPWGTEGAEPPSACMAGPVETFTPIDPMDCPMLVEGDNNGFPSAALERTFRLFVPSDWSADRKWPVVFLWHGLGQTQDEIQADAQLEAMVDEKGFILVVPDSQTPDRRPGVEWDQLTVGENEDLVFFDDMLTCVDKQYGADLDRVHSSGLSAGGLFTTYLTMFRSAKIASSVAFSGGLLVPYPDPADKRPMIAAWGGPTDEAFMQNFDNLAHNLIDTLVPAGHFVVACDHGQGHKWLPEFTPWAFQFLMDHPRGVSPEPYAAGLPVEFPAFCSIAAAP